MKYYFNNYTKNTSECLNIEQSKQWEHCLELWGIILKNIELLRQFKTDKVCLLTIDFNIGRTVRLGNEVLAKLCSTMGLKSEKHEFTLNMEIISLLIEAIDE